MFEKFSQNALKSILISHKRPITPIQEKFLEREGLHARGIRPIPRGSRGAFTLLLDRETNTMKGNSSLRNGIWRVFLPGYHYYHSEVDTMKTVFSAGENVFSPFFRGEQENNVENTARRVSPRIRRRFHPPVAPSSLSVSRVSIHFDVASFPVSSSSPRSIISSARSILRDGSPSIDRRFGERFEVVRDSFRCAFQYSFLFFFFFFVQDTYNHNHRLVFRIYSFSINFPINRSRPGFLPPVKPFHASNPLGLDRGAGVAFG